MSRSIVQVLLVLPLLVTGCRAVAAPPLVEAEIVVTAPRTTNPLEVVTDPGKPRQPLPAHDGADYLKTIPGFSVIRKGGTDGDPLFRGMAGSRINVLTSDAMLLGGCGARMDPPTAYVFPQSYDSIRVLKGPQSVLWGAGSAATVLFEREPYDHAADGSHLTGSLLTGSWGRRDLAADALVGKAAGYLRLQGSDSRSDAYRSGAGDAVHGDYHRWNAHATFGWTPQQRTLLELSLARSDGEAAYADRAMDGTSFAREAVTLRLRHDSAVAWISNIDAHIAHGYVDHVMDNFSLRGLLSTPGMPAPMLSNPDRETLAARLGIGLELSDSLTAVVGLDAHQDEHRVRRAMGEATSRYRSLERVTDARFRQRGGFAELTYEPTPGRTWLSGARVDQWRVEDLRDSLRQGMAIVPNDTNDVSRQERLTSAFLRYEHRLQRGHDPQTPDVVLFVGAGHAERPADYWERFGNDSRGVNGASALLTSPERTTQLDLGIIRHSASSRLAISLFVNQVADYILIDSQTAAAGAVTRNVAARSMGGELDYGRELGRGWSVESTLAYTRGYNRSDDVPLAQMPPLEARLALAHSGERFGRRFTAGGLLRWVAQQNRVDPGRGNIVGLDLGPSPAFTVLSVNGSYRLSSALSVAAGVDNVLDADYAEHLSRSGAMVAGFVQSQRIQEPGRTLWLKLDMSL